MFDSPFHCFSLFQASLAQSLELFHITDPSSVSIAALVPDIDLIPIGLAVQSIGARFVPLSQNEQLTPQPSNVAWRWQSMLTGSKVILVVMMSTGVKCSCVSDQNVHLLN